MTASLTADEPRDGEHQPTTRQFHDLKLALDFLAQPLVLEMLKAAHDRAVLTRVITAEVDQMAVATAVRRLTRMGLLAVSATGPLGRNVLTPRGADLVEVLADLASVIGEEGAP